MPHGRTGTRALATSLRRGLAAEPYNGRLETAALRGDQYLESGREGRGGHPQTRHSVPALKLVSDAPPRRPSRRTKVVWPRHAIRAARQQGTGRERRESAVRASHRVGCRDPRAGHPAPWRFIGPRNHTSQLPGRSGCVRTTPPCHTPIVNGRTFPRFPDRAHGLTKSRTHHREPQSKARLIASAVAAVDDLCRRRLGAPRTPHDHCADGAGVLGRAVAGQSRHQRVALTTRTSASFRGSRRHAANTTMRRRLPTALSGAMPGGCAKAT